MNNPEITPEPVDDDEPYQTVVPTEVFVEKAEDQTQSDNRANSIPYDSTADTQAHIRRVSILLNNFAIALLERSNRHDDSKLIEPEKSAFDRETPLLKGLTYGSPEYKEALGRLGVALQHHYLWNTHHPEHYEKGIDQMDLLDIVEMLWDWKAASERHADGDIYKSIAFNKGRFGISEQLCQIFVNTMNRLPIK